jgi:hypothetical protein
MKGTGAGVAGKIKEGLGRASHPAPRSVLQPAPYRKYRSRTCPQIRAILKNTST